MRNDLATALMFVVSAAVWAQTAPGELTEVRSPGFVAPVKAAPYSAEVFNTLTFPARNGVPEREFFQRRKIFRDSKGRVRTELIAPVGLPGGPHVLVTLIDQSAGRECFLNTEDRLAHCFSSIPIVAPPPVPSDVAIEDLGIKTISGVRVEGTRSTRRPSNVTSESWFSPELHVNIETKIDDVGRLRNTEATENIRREEPDPRLFEVPTDFKIIEETGDRAVIFSGVDIVNTMLLVRAQPAYTAEARRKHIEGTVTLSLIVGADGVPTDIRVEHSLDAGLDQSAVAAVRQWRWDPARVNGKPSRTLNSVRVNFKFLANAN